MNKKSGPDKAPAERVIKDIRRATRRQFSAEEKIRIVLEGLRGEDSVASSPARSIDQPLGRMSRAPIIQMRRSP
jgi:transposase